MDRRGAIMTIKKTKGSDSAGIRQRAEEALRQADARIPANLNTLSSEEVKKTLQELQIHRIELEMQNEELRRSRAEAEAGRERYADPYDFAPAGYFTLTDQGVILEVNLTAAHLLGTTRDDLISKPITRFIYPDDQDIYTLHGKRPLETETPRSCELRLVKKDTAFFWVRWDETAARDSQDRCVRRVVMIDMTEHKRSEEALRASEDRYRSLVENSNDLIFTLSPQGTFLFLSPSVLPLMGYDATSLLGRSFQSIIHPEDVSACEEALRKNLQEGARNQGIEYRIRHAGGEWRWHTSTGRPVRDGQGKLIHFQGIARDIHDRKRAEDALLQEAKRLDLAQSAAEAGIWDWDVVTGRIEWSRHMFSLFGLDPQKATASFESWRSVLHPDDAEIAGQRIDKALKERTPLNSDYRIVLPDGQIRWINAKGEGEYDADGRPVRLLGICIDITERKRMEIELKKRENLWRKIFEILPVGLWIADKQGKLQSANPMGLKIWGAEPHVGQEEYGVFKARRLPSGAEIAPDDWALAHTVNEGVTVVDEMLEIDAFDGQKKIILNFTAPVLDDDGKIQVAIVVNHDITQRCKAEEEVRLNEARLESLLRIARCEAKSVQQLLDFALEEAISLTYSKIGYIYSYDDTKKEFRLNTWSRDVMKECRINEPQTLYELEKTGLWGEVVRQGKPIIVNDFQAPHPLKKGYPEGHAPLFKYVTIPLFSRGRIVAVVAVANKETDYDASDVRQLNLLMDSVWRITEQRQAEIAMLHAEKKYRDIFENAQEGIYRSTFEGRFITANQTMATLLGYDSAEELMDTVTDMTHEVYALPEERDTVRRLLQGQGVLKGFEVRFKRKDGRCIWVSLNVLAVRDAQDRLLYYDGICEDITERKESIGRLRKALGATVQAIATVVETRDPYTAGHQKRVADLSRAIAKEMGLSDDRVDGLRMAAMIHDIGKIAVPAEILSRPTKLTDIEFGLIKIHPRSGYDILKDLEFPWPIARMILEHHERMDGSGYPNGLTGNKLLPESQILAVADVVEAIASHRPYRPAIGIDAALEEIEKNRGALYDPGAADACLRLFREKGFRLEAV